MQNQAPRPDWLSALLGCIAYRTASNPIWTACAAGLVTCLALVLTASRLEFQTSRLALLSPQAAYNQRWLSFLDRFGKEDDAVIVVSHPDPRRVAAALTDAGTRLEADSRLSGVLYRQSLGNVARKSLYLMPTEQLSQLLQLLQALTKVASYPGENRTVAAAGHSERPLDLGTSPLNSLFSAIRQTQIGLSELADSIPAEGPLLLEDGGTLGLCLVRMPHIDDEPQRALDVIRVLTEQLQALRTRYPEVQFGLTGMPILEWDESRSSQRDMQKATLLSLVGVALIFVFGFGSWRMPCVAVLCLAIGLVWTVALAALFIGHLNLFSVAFGAIIAGLGIDYAIHLLSRLLTSNTDNLRADALPSALAEAVTYCGKGIVTGAVTTAAAFAVAVLTPFKGMTELGLICALGTLVCLFVTLVVLPAFVVLQARYLPSLELGRWASRLAVVHTCCMCVLDWSNRSTMRYRVPMLISTALVTIYSATQIPRLAYDHNLLNLQADDAPSVQAEHQLTSRSQHSAWFAVSMARSPAAARALHERLSKLPSVARVDEIGGVLATGHNPTVQPLVAACRDQALQLSIWLEKSTDQNLALTQSPSGSISPASYHAASPLDVQTADQIKQLTQSIAAMSAPEPPTLADFPVAVRTRMTSTDGQTFLLRIFAKENLWKRENLQQFVRELESVDPRVTGHPIQTWYASGELENSYYQAGVYAMLTVCALLMLDLRSIRLVALSLIPVGISFVQLCGWLVAMEIPLNAANMIVLPLIIGIGIDDGVHIMHDFSHRGRARYSLSRSTTLAVLLTSLTTMVGFGCMSMADHRGLQSLGIVLLTGVGLCLMHSWFTLPAILSFFGPAVVGDVPPSMEAIPGQPVMEAKGEAATPGAQPILLSDIPVVMSLPDYPELSGL